MIICCSAAKKKPRYRGPKPISLEIGDIKRLKDAFGNERKRVYKPSAKYRTRRYRKKKASAAQMNKDDFEIQSVSSESSDDEAAMNEGENL